MPDTTQDIAAAETYEIDWTRHIAQLPDPTVILASVGTVVASDGATVSGKSLDATNKKVVFKLDLSTTTATAPNNITVTLQPTLSNGDTPVRHFTIGLRSD